MLWNSIDSQADLATLERLVDHDSNMLELYTSQKDEAFFPNDVCRDGYQHLNWRLVLNGHGTNAAFIEMVFISCDRLTWSWIQGPHFQGKVDSLRRVELYGYSNSLSVRCGRMIYRTHNHDVASGMNIIADALSAARRAP